MRVFEENAPLLTQVHYSSDRSPQDIGIAGVEDNDHLVLFTMHMKSSDSRVKVCKREIYNPGTKTPRPQSRTNCAPIEEREARNR